MAAATTALLRSSASRALCSASAVVCKQVTGAHVLRIDGYSHLHEVIGTGHRVQSSIFSVGGHSWRLGVYPNGDSTEFEGQVGAYIFITSDPANQLVSARTKFSILDRLGNPGLVKETGMRSFNKDGTWGFGGLIGREDLEKSEYLNNDSFVIRCDITVTTVTERPDHVAFLAGNTEPDITPA